MLTEVEKQRSYSSATSGAVAIEPPAALSAPTRRWSRWLLPLVGLVVLLVALDALRTELRGHTYREISLAVRSIPSTQVRSAFALTLLAFLILPLYDGLALAYVGRLRVGGSTKDDARRISLWRATFAAVVAYGVSQTAGFAALTGNAVRYRFWSAWGLSTADIVRAAGFLGFTFVLGVMLVGGLALVIEPGSELTSIHFSADVARVVGALLVATVVVYVALALRARGRSLRVPRMLAGRAASTAEWTFTAPSPTIAIGQLVVPMLDWTVAALVLWVILPQATRPSFAAFLGLFVVAQFAGLVSHVPGGAGIVESIVVLGLRPVMSAGDAIAAVIAYRFVYYIVPFATALVLFAVHEAQRRSARLRLATRAAAQSMAVVATVARGTGDLAATLGASFVPGAAAAGVFAAGTVLLFSGAAPSIHARVEALLDVVPLGVLEVSHVMASITGALLLVLAWALGRRLKIAWALTIALLGVGAVASLLKGLDWEEAIVLSSVLVALLPFRAAFYRRSAITAEPFGPGWSFAILAIVGVAVTIGMFSYQHVQYDTDLWWLVRPHADAPRFLRATFASSLALAVIGGIRIFGRARPAARESTAVLLPRAERVASSARDTSGFLALLGDKSLMFLEASERAPDDPDGFIQYRVVGRSWIALGDPVVADVDASPRAVARVRRALAWRFKRDAEIHEGRPVFYEVGPDLLPLYIDLGLTFMKLGEDARVELSSFSLDGGNRRQLRRAVKDGERAGLTFQVVDPADVTREMDAMRRVSDDWLSRRNVREKGFSIGFFDESYLRRFPAAFVRDGRTGELLAFANVWPGAQRRELSIDLMRHASHAPKPVMDFLFVHLLLWGRERGYGWFDLGMAPLAGLEADELAPTWARFGAWLYRHGEHFYNYQGLRQYKEKFDPIWEPRYLASPGGLALPRILANVATLISRGVTGVVRK